MKQKLLLLTLLLLSITGFSQTMAYPVPNLQQCQSEVFNLTVQVPVVLGSQNPQQHSVTFHTSMAAAQAGTNAIASPASYVGLQSQTLYIRVTNITTGTFAVRSFNISWQASLMEPNNIVTCGSYILPALQQGSYYTGPNGTGVLLAPGTAITTSSTLYVYLTNGMCSVQRSFTITIINFPVATPAPADITICGSYTLPALQQGNYYTGPNGTGMIIPPGSVVTVSSTLYIFTQNGVCSSEESFTITVINLQVGTPASLVVCTDDPSGMAVVDLTVSGAEIAAGNPGLIITYYISQQGAQSGLTGEMIQNPQGYSVFGSSTVYVRVEDVINGCIKIVPLQINVVPCTANSISGKVRFDYNNNGCTVADYPAENISVYSTQGATVYQTFTNANGDYSFANIPDGANTVTVTPPATFTSTPASHTVTMPGSGTGKDFCLISTNSVNDVAVYFFPVSQARPGFAATYSLVLKNLGTMAVSGNVAVSYPGTLMTFASASPAMVQSGSSLTYSYANLLPFQSKTIHITMMVKTPPTVISGTPIALTAAVSPAGNDSNTANNMSMINQLAVNSYDPNDIAVHEGAYITEQQADNDYLHYTIRFQNIGNADAVNVSIETSLDNKLDWSTLQPVAASHAYNMVRKDDDVTFSFNTINLPGSTVNEPGSHGYITYRIKPKAAVTLGDVMTANAGIYFDFNEVVNTNTVTTTVQNAMGVADFGTAGFMLYPNPASGSVTVQIQDVASAEVTIVDVLGKTVLQKQITEKESTIDITGLNSGMYFIKLKSGGKEAVKKLMVK
jgi:hypothetical protein